MSSGLRIALATVLMLLAPALARTQQGAPADMRAGAGAVVGASEAEPAPDESAALPPKTPEEAAQRLGFSVARDVPLVINSGELEVRPDKAGLRRVVFQKDVHAVQGDMRLDCDWLEAVYPKSGAGQPDRVTARGHVRILQATNTARCQEAVFDNVACTATCSGASERASLHRGEDVIEADQIVFDLCEGLVRARGGATVRVQGATAAAK